MRYPLSWPLSFCVVRLFNPLAAVSPTPNVRRGVGQPVSWLARRWLSLPAPPPPPSQAVVIATQPVSQVIPITQTANFTVTATGTAPRSRGESLSASQKRIRPMKSWATMFVVALNSLVSPSPFHSSE